MVGRPNKPNELHVLEGTARADRGTDITLTITDENSTPPKLRDLSSIDRDATFDMFKDWVIAATGSAQIDEILLSMMVDQLDVYAEAKASGDARGMGAVIDRYHKLAREFGMTPATRSQFAKKAMGDDEDAMKSIMGGP